MYLSRFKELVLSGMFFLLILGGTKVLANWNEEKRKIDFLLVSIETLDVIFIRNSKEYGAVEAVAHLRMKLKSAQSSWFAPDQEKWTVKMFIEKIASKSSLTGKPYQIKFPDGRTTLANDWLYLQLAKTAQKKL